jgi:hypothetical protein
MVSLLVCFAVALPSGDELLDERDRTLFCTEADSSLSISSNVGGFLTFSSPVFLGL